MRTGSCDRCGEAFVDRSRRQNRRFCSENCRKRACDDSNRAICVDCGQALGARSGWPDAAKRGAQERCRACEDHRRHEGFLALGRKVETWWAEGLTHREIADRLGWGPNSHSGVLTHRLREAGFDLPRRPKDRFHHHRRAS